MRRDDCERNWADVGWGKAENWLYMEELFRRNSKTEEELPTISDHVLALENILKGAKKPVRCIFPALCGIE